MLIQEKKPNLTLKEIIEEMKTAELGIFGCQPTVVLKNEMHYGILHYDGEGFAFVFISPNGAWGLDHDNVYRILKDNNYKFHKIISYHDIELMF